MEDIKGLLGCSYLPLLTEFYTKCKQRLLSRDESQNPSTTILKSQNAALHHPPRRSCHPPSSYGCSSRGKCFPIFLHVCQLTARRNEKHRPPALSFLPPTAKSATVQAMELRLAILLEIWVTVLDWEGLSSRLILGCKKEKAPGMREDCI